MTTGLTFPLFVFLTLLPSLFFLFTRFEGIKCLLFSLTPVVASNRSLLHINNPAHVYSVQCDILALQSKQTGRAWS